MKFKKESVAFILAAISTLSLLGSASLRVEPRTKGICCVIHKHIKSTLR